MNLHQVFKYREFNMEDSSHRYKVRRQTVSETAQGLATAEARVDHEGD